MFDTFCRVCLLLKCRVSVFGGRCACCNSSKENITVALLSRDKAAYGGQKWGLSISLALKIIKMTTVRFSGKWTIY